MDEFKNLTADEYLIPASETTAEIKVKGSKFIATVMPVCSKDRAESVYNQLKKKYYNATHNCFAYRIDADTFRYSDDGEPSGTAGKPILQSIDARNIFEVLCIVTRYFGGTKLGTGGLIRSYSEVASKALSQLKIKIKVKTEKCRLIFNYEMENTVRKLINEFKGKIIDSNYSDHISMFVALPESKCSAFKKKMIDLSNSTVSIRNP